MAIELKVNTVLTTHFTAATGLLITVDGASSTKLDNITPVVTFQWTLLDLPDGSGDALSGVTGSSETITVNNEGGYLIELITDIGTADEQVTASVVSIPTLKKGLHIPAAGEEVEFSGGKGWQRKLELMWKAYARAGSFHFLTVGDQVGADYTSVNAALADLAAGKFGPVPNSATGDIYVIEMLKDLDTNVVIPDGITIRGNGHDLIGAGAAGARVTINGVVQISDFVVPVNPSKPTDPVILVSGAGVLDARNIIGDSADRFVCVDGGGAAVLQSIGVDDPIEVIDGDLTIIGSIVESALLNEGTLVGIASSLGTITVTNGAPVIANVILEKVSAIVGGLVVNANITGTGTLAGFSGTVANASGTFVLDLRQQADTISFDDAAVPFTAAEVQTAIEQLATGATTISRDTIVIGGGGLLADTDLAITNVAYVRDGDGNSEDFLNVLVTVDGDLQATDGDEVNTGNFDVYPGSTGAFIKFGYALVAAQVVQVIRT